LNKYFKEKIEKGNEMLNYVVGRNEENKEAFEMGC
jgi:hypothetical protein